METTLRLPSGHLLPPLRIVPADAVRLHEDADPRRVDGLIRRLREEGVLRNPPVAAELAAGGYVVLDGANRTAAMLRLGLPFHLLQIVEYGAPEIRLEVWHHLLREDGGLTDEVTELGGVSLEHGKTVENALTEGRLACAVVTERAVIGVPAPHGLAGKIAALRAVVDRYAGRRVIYRVPTTDLETLRTEYDTVGALVVFPVFGKGEILALADEPAKVPTGITRHVIPNRVLRINLPLDLLETPAGLEARNQALRDLLHARLLEHRVRYYAEPTILLDE